jgi:chemotaxis protein MotA
MVIVDVLRAMGGAAPSFGMFGTLFGLIVMLGELDDPSNMGPGLAAALMTTLYGIIFARFVFYPIAEKIKNAAQMNKFREYFVLEGIVLINDKKSSFYIQDKLSTYLQRDFKKQKAA